MLTYIEGPDGKFRIQIDTFDDNFYKYKDTFNVPVPKMTQFSLGRKMLDFYSTRNDIVQQFAFGSTGYKNEIRHGNGTLVLGAIPDLNPLPTVLPTLCIPNLEGLFREIIGLLVKSGKLTESIAQDLGILHSMTLEDIEEGQPNLTIKLVAGGYPILHCDIHFFEGYEIWKDEGTGYKKLDTSNHAKYTDTSPLPAKGVTATVKYKTIYKYQNAVVGKWSVEVVVPLYGHV